MTQKNTFSKLPFYLFALLSIVEGLYPAIYFFVDRTFGLLDNKSTELLANFSWNTGFYGHIVFAGLALLIGWVQFSASFRQKHINVHRIIGRIYVASALVSAVCGGYIAFYATGGLIAILGFFLLAVVWFYTTLRAFIHIYNGDIDKHQQMMIYSFAACFAAVTLRLWLPILIAVFGDFIPAYQIVAWLCWVPNLIIAYFIVQRKKQNS